LPDPLHFLNFFSNFQFEQLTLRRPRNQQQIISSSKNKETKTNNMILAKQQEENRNNIEINILNFNEEQNKLKNNETSFSSFKNNLNSVKLSNQNDNMKNSFNMKQDNNSKILNSTTLNGFVFKI